MEVWKDIKGYEGYYQVSNKGRIKSLSRKIFNGKSYYVSKEKILKIPVAKNGYYTVVLYKNNSLKAFQVHQLIAINFLNHKPCKHKLVVNHIDTNKLNNDISNLEIISHRKNTDKKHIKSSSKYVGVRKLKNTNFWQSRIYIKGKRIYLGNYKNEYNAHLAYQKALSFIENNENITKEEFKIKVKEWRADNRLI